MLRVVLVAQVQRAHVYVAAEFGGWQAHVLRWLAQHYDEEFNSFAKEAASGVIAEVHTIVSRGVQAVTTHDSWGTADLSAEAADQPLAAFGLFIEHWRHPSVGTAFQANLCRRTGSGRSWTGRFVSKRHHEACDAVCPVPHEGSTASREAGAMLTAASYTASSFHVSSFQTSYRSRPRCTCRLHCALAACSVRHHQASLESTSYHDTRACLAKAQVFGPLLLIWFACSLIGPLRRCST